MMVHYKRGPGSKSFTYRCRGDYDTGGTVCGALPGRAIDRAVVAAILDRLSPPNVSALREALDAAITDSYATKRQRETEIERLRHEAADLEQKLAMLDAGSHRVFKMLEGRLEKTGRQVERLESAIADDPRRSRRATPLMVRC